MARFAVEYTRIVRSAFFKDGGFDPEAVYVMRVVWIGSLERKPMQASKIALYADLPRTTVIRKLAQLIARGYVVRRGEAYEAAEHLLYGHHSGFEELADLVLRTAKALDRNGHQDC